MDRSRRKELDGLRGLAALIVLVAHVSNEVGLWSKLLGHGAGKVGVMIFFCLSGYLMGALYLQRRPNSDEVLRYGVHRLSRVAPLYFAVVAFSFAGGILFTDSLLYPVNSDNLLRHLIFYRGVSVLWTIPVEVQFYAAFVLLWLARSASRFLFVALCVVLLPSLWLIAENMTKIGSTLIAWAPYFIVGLLVSEATESKDPSRLYEWSWSGLFIVAAFMTALLFPQIALEVGGQKFLDAVQIRPWHNPWSYAVIALLVASTLRAPIAKILLANPAMVYAGAISYSVYLMHDPVMEILQRNSSLAQQPEIFLLATVAVTGLVASLCFYFFENPVRHRLNAVLRREKKSTREHEQA